jgi:hypothetical protein
LCSIAFLDVDNDNDQDVIIAGENCASAPSTKLYIHESQISSTEELASAFDLAVVLYPHPTPSTTLNVSFNSEENDLVNIKVYDVNDQLLKEQEDFAAIGQQALSVDVLAWVPGNYFVEISIGSRTGLAKFIVQ